MWPLCMLVASGVTSNDKRNNSIRDIWGRQAGSLTGFSGSIYSPYLVLYLCNMFCQPTGWFIRCSSAAQKFGRSRQNFSIDGRRLRRLVSALLQAEAVRPQRCELPKVDQALPFPVAHSFLMFVLFAIPPFFWYTVPAPTSQVTN